MSERIELGCAGHLIVAKDCRFRRHTQIIGEARSFRVSTVGDLYYPDDPKRQTVGSGESDYFETMVFETTPEPEAGNEGCGCRAVVSWSEIDTDRYATAGRAQIGHERMVERYAAIADDDPPGNRRA